MGLFKITDSIRVPAPRGAGVLLAGLAGLATRQPRSSSTSAEIEVIQIHHLGPGRHEVADELLLRVRTSIGFSQCPQLGIRAEHQIDTVIPVSGKAVIAGTTDDGATLRDAATDIGTLHSRIKYL